MASSRRLRKHYRRLKNLKLLSTSADSPELIQMTKQYSLYRSQHRKLIRSVHAKEAISRDSNLMKNPGTTFAHIRASRRANAGKIHKLNVGDSTFFGENVPDGFFMSVHQLKTRNNDVLETSPHFLNISSDYHNIIKLSKDSKDIEPITEMQSLQILESVKSDVFDIHGITPNHYLYAGPTGCKHFFLLMNAFLQDVNSTSIEEINATYACILFKGHGKDKSSARSYRTISTCPVVAKGIDLYLRTLHEENWNAAQSESQFQGKGSSHELAALLVTECILHSKHTLKLPTFALYLDAKSAFDAVLKEILVRNLYFTQGLDKSLLLINNRLGNRVTYVDWDESLMGPIHDELGLEQGGTNSSEYYKIFGKEQLDLAQELKLGIWLGKNLCVSGIGQADDTILIIYNYCFILLLLTVRNILLTFLQRRHGCKLSFPPRSVIISWMRPTTR